MRYTLLLQGSTRPLLVFFRSRPPRISIRIETLPLCLNSPVKSSEANNRRNYLIHHRKSDLKNLALVVVAYEEIPAREKGKKSRRVVGVTLASIHEANGPGAIRHSLPPANGHLIRNKQKGEKKKKNGIDRQNLGLHSSFCSPKN
jgi:hypothetical protein